MSRYTRRNLRKRTRSSRANANRQARVNRRLAREEASGENVELRNALNVSEEPDQPSPSHVCDPPLTTYSSFVTFNNLSIEAVTKLRNDIEKLKAHLSAAHAELEDLNDENVNFKRTMSQYKKKVDYIDKVVSGREEMPAEPGTSAQRNLNEEVPSTSGSKPYQKPTCTQTVPDESSDSSDNDSDDDSDREDDSDDEDSENDSDDDSDDSDDQELP